MSTPYEFERLTTDVLIVGGGVAALRAAIAAREAGAEVTLCAKGIAGRSGNTVVSTADISAYIPEFGTDDSLETYTQDTTTAGNDIGDPRLIEILTERSGPAVLDLERHGVVLLRDGTVIDRTRSAGHSRARTYRADAHGRGPNKGLALSIPLMERCRALGVQVLDRTPVVHLLVSDGALTGALAVDLQRPRLVEITCGSMVAAAGGASYLFSRTNATVDATGDLIALGLQAGAAARDIEFVQWHPTRMDEPVALFLTNGFLADGAVFRNSSGHEFMTDYDPRGNLAPRDVLSKSIYLEAQAGRGVAGGVYLDCSAIPEERLQLRHAHVTEVLRKHGVDFPREWVVVSPSAHFLMGGLGIDEDAASSLPGLFVAGENAGGIHGANRLGGNAFCEGLVFGTIAGEQAAKYAQSVSRRAADPEAHDLLRELLDPRVPDPRPTLAEHWQSLRLTMWAHVSLVREASGLEQAERLLSGLGEEVATLRTPTLADAARVLELRAGLACAQAIIAAAKLRTESRGAHWRADYPARDDHWQGSIWVTWPTATPHPALEFRSLASVPVAGR